MLMFNRRVPCPLLKVNRNLCSAGPPLDFETGVSKRIGVLFAEDHA